MQSRYYDPAIGRFINADNVILSGGGSAQAYNLFAYCFNNPINMSDSSGNWPKLSTVLLDASQMALQIAVATAVIGVCALALPAVLATGAAIASCATVATAAFTVATCASGVSVAAATAAVVADRIEKKATKTYSVYFLEDESGTIRYVGRVTDSGYETRMTYHYNTRGLTPKYRAYGLTYAQARGLEEIGIIECHTLNALYPQNNQIHGIGPRNKNGKAYLDAAEDYLVNRAENWLLNLIS